MTITESDWKRFKPLKEHALARICDSILEEIELAASRPELSSHDRYLNIYSIVQERNREIAQIFDGLSRSKALMQLSMMQSRSLITPEEIAEFGESTREFLERSRP